MDDATLVEAARSGDSSAWGSIYDRYADRLHDHCHRLLRDRDEAADALHDAFLAASRSLHQLRDPSRLRPWLYSICRHEALRRARRRSRVELTDEVDEMRAVEVDLDRGTSAAELQELVWAAAAGLGERDQALLDLNLRQGLEGQDLADAMGVSLSASYVLMSRLRDQVERSLGALLIARLGREDCRDLAAILDGWDGRFTPLLRKRVARHVDRCDTCSTRRAAALSPAALLAAAPVVPAPADLRDRVLATMSGDAPAPAVEFTAEGFAAPPPRSRSPRRGWLAAAAAAVLVVAGVGAAVTVAGDDRRVDPSLAASEGSSTETSEPTSTSSTSTTEPASSSPSSTATTPTTPPLAEPPPDPAGPPATPAPTVAPPPPSADRRAPVIGRLTSSAASIQTTACNPDNDSTTILALVTDDVAVATVVLSWTGEPGAGSTPMAPGAGGHHATLPSGGALTGPGELTYTVTATDAAGNVAQRSGTVTVDPCPG